MDPKHRQDKPDEEAATTAGPPAVPQAPAAAPPAPDGPGKATPRPDPAAESDASSNHDDHHAIKAKLKRKDHEIKELKKEIHELNDKYLRIAAEMENSRKRLEREKSDFLQFALADALRELLGVQDNFDRALKSLSGSENPSAIEGIALIAKQIAELLRRRGVVEIEVQGKPFDPTLHSAVASEESAEVSEPTVGEVLQKGFLLHDRLLRPAMVKVLVPVRS